MILFLSNLPDGICEVQSIKIGLERELLLDGTVDHYPSNKITQISFGFPLRHRRNTLAFMRGLFGQLLYGQYGSLQTYMIVRIIIFYLQS